MPVVSAMPVVSVVPVVTVVPVVLVGERIGGGNGEGKCWW